MDISRKVIQLDLLFLFVCLISPTSLKKYLSYICNSVQTITFWLPVPIDCHISPHWRYLLSDQKSLMLPWPLVLCTGVTKSVGVLLSWASELMCQHHSFSVTVWQHSMLLEFSKMMILFRATELLIHKMYKNHKPFSWWKLQLKHQTSSLFTELHIIMLTDTPTHRDKHQQKIPLSGGPRLREIRKHYFPAFHSVILVERLRKVLDYFLIVMVLLIIFFRMIGCPLVLHTTVCLSSNCSSLIWINPAR